MAEKEISIFSLIWKPRAGGQIDLTFSDESTDVLEGLTGADFMPLVALLTATGQHFYDPATGVKFAPVDA